MTIAAYCCYWQYPSRHPQNPVQSSVQKAFLDTGATSTGLRQDIIDALTLPTKGLRMIGTDIMGKSNFQISKAGEIMLEL